MSAGHPPRTSSCSDMGVEWGGSLFAGIGCLKRTTVKRASEDSGISREALLLWLLEVWDALKVSLDQRAQDTHQRRQKNVVRGPALDQYNRKSQATRRTKRTQTNNKQKHSRWRSSPN